MIRPRRKDGKSGSSQKGRKRYKVEFGFWQLLNASLALFAVLTWMFVFGVLVGRGIPLTASKDASITAQLLRFIGLGRQEPPPPENAADLWEDPKKILSSLDYYQSLAKTPDRAAAKPFGKTRSDRSMARTGKASGQPSSGADQPASEQPSQGSSAALHPGKAGSGTEPAEPASVRDVSERFTLMAASLKEPENAQRLVQRLKAKGYSCRLEAVDMSGSGRWNRVLVGSFETREEAMQFAAEFNRKEGMEALVIREGS